MGLSRVRAEVQKRSATEMRLKDFFSDEKTGLRGSLTDFRLTVLLSLYRAVRELNVSAIVTMHDLNLASLYADRVIMLKKWQNCFCRRC